MSVSCRLHPLLLWLCCVNGDPEQASPRCLVVRVCDVVVTSPLFVGVSCAGCWWLSVDRDGIGAGGPTCSLVKSHSNVF